MSKKTKAFLYNFLGFAPIYMVLYFLIITFTHLQGVWVPVTAAVITSIIAPKFQAVNYEGHEKIFMKWMFLKGVKEVK